MFNPHDNVTADGTLITEGMRVKTNDWIEGTVIADRDAGQCCGGVHSTNHHGEEKGQIKIDGAWFTDHGAAREKYGCHQYCGHNHWFSIALDNGGTSMQDGERLKAI